MLNVTSQESPSRIKSEIIEISILVLGLVLISFTSIVNYLLFHSIAEIFSIVIAGGVFFIGLNSRKYMKSSFFLIIGISSLFVGFGFGILKLCKFEELWHNYRTTCETLKNEKIQYDIKIGIYDKADNPEKTFVERAQTIISKETTIWSSTVKKK